MLQPCANPDCSVQFAVGIIRCPACGTASEIKPHAPEISAPSEISADTDGRRRVSLGPTVLIAMGGLAILVAAYVMLIWLPNRNRLLLEHELKKFALLYHEFNDAHGRPPSTLADLESFIPRNTINPPDFYRAPRAFEMVRNNRFLILWDAALLPDGNANDKYVLGYEPKASEVVGLVMRAGGTVRHLTASEFNALPKIKTRTEK